MKLCLVLVSVLALVIAATAESSRIKIASNKPFVEKGNPIVLTCNATGEESAPRDVDWFKDGVKVKQNQNRGLTISSFRLAATRTLHSQLEIDHSEMTDAGNYICRSSRDIVSTSVVVLNARSSHDCNAAMDIGKFCGVRGSSKWYYNQIVQKCRDFYYLGCGGNSNRFDTQWECMRACH